MNFYPVFCFGAGILSFGAGLFVFLENKKARLNQAWFLCNLAISVWIISLGGTMATSSPNLALFFQKVLYVGTTFIPVYFVHFSLFLIGDSEKAKKFFRLNLVFSIFFLITLFFYPFIYSPY